MADKKTRNIKVCRQPGYDRKPTPEIKLSGQWLRSMGFEIGSLLKVQCEDGKLVILLDKAREEELEAERAFMEAERMLSGILEPLRERYDYILVDTCPSLGSLTINALSAADGVIVTVNPQLLAMMGLQDFLKTVGKIRGRINPALRVEGILLTMCDARTNLCRVITEQVAETFQGQVRIFGSRIPSIVKVGESIYYSRPLMEYVEARERADVARSFLDVGEMSEEIWEWFVKGACVYPDGRIEVRWNFGDEA